MLSSMSVYVASLSRSHCLCHFIAVIVYILIDVDMEEPWKVLYGMYIYI